MKNLGYYNGKISLLEDLQIPATDRAFYFGDGVYDAVMCRNNIPYLLDLHIDRLYKNCSTLDINPPVDKKELKATICELVKKVDANEKFVYFHISRGSQIRDHAYEDLKGNLFISITEREITDIKRKMKCILAKDIRYELCNIKTLNLLPSVLTAQMSKNKCSEEAIMYRSQDFVTEGSHSNVSILKNGTLITAPNDKYILPGVTRAHIIEIANKNGVPVEERRYSVNELFSADEIIISSSSKMARGVSEIDNIPVGGKDKKLLSLFNDTIYNNYLKATSLPLEGKVSAR